MPRDKSPSIMIGEYGKIRDPPIDLMVKKRFNRSPPKKKGIFKLYTSFNQSIGIQGSNKMALEMAITVTKFKFPMMFCISAPCFFTAYHWVMFRVTASAGETRRCFRGVFPRFQVEHINQFQDYIGLVVYLPLWRIWKSVGMMKFPIYMEK